MKAAVATALLLFAADAYEKARLTMVKEHLEARGIRDARVLAAIRDTPRHEYVPAELQAHAYEDRPLPIGYNQTISQPYIVGLMTQLLETKPEHIVLELGSGSGYQSAILSKLAKHVYSIEIVPELAASATKALQRTGCRNVTVRHGDGYKGWPEQAPFDRIILTAAPPEIPQALIDQLKPGGKLVAPEGEAEQLLMVIEKSANGALSRRSVIPVLFVPMVRGTSDK
ncbi:MAG: protein-L-isoaspartate(D-aspartate) O-methyltransferase [Acidobacteria bacterium]|nr:protein-L-isoaspartate(D-aspartate) O-methyltransferase [Acidobacteriota bacterium]